MKTVKILIVAFCVIIVSSALFADGTKGKVTFRGGMFFPMLSSTTSWSGSWDFHMLEVTQEGGNQSIEGENAFLFNGSVAVFVTPQFAIEGMFGYCKTNAPVNSTFSETHYWWDPYRRGPYSHSYDYSTEGSLSITPISFNGLYQFETTNSITPYISGGLSIAPCSFKADANTGFVYSWYAYLLQIAEVITDANLQIDESFTSLGINVGGGVDIKISSSIEINIEARYIYLQKKEFNWEMLPGTVNGEYWGQWTLTQGTADELENEYLTQAVVVNPSIFSISGGITIRF